MTGSGPATRPVLCASRTRGCGDLHQQPTRRPPARSGLPGGDVLLEARPGLHAVPPMPPAARVPGRYLNRDTGATV